MGSRHQFGLADYLVFAVTVLISVAIGIYYALSGGERRSTADYLLAGRKMSFIPVGISLFVSFESSIMMLGLPAESYMYGIQMFVAFFALSLGNLLCAWITVPLLHPLKITSSFEYLELRFKSRAVRVMGSAMGIMFDMCYMGVVLFGPAVALQAVTDFPLWISIVGLALAAVIYTTIGGMRAVIWTDVFQTLVMFTGIFAILIQGTLRVGGAREVWNTADRGGRMQFFNFNFDPRERHTFWNLNLALTIRAVSMAFRQSTVQRVCSTPSLKDAKRVIIIVVPFCLLVSCLALYEGIVAYAFYAKQECDPFASGQLEDPNQIVPFIVMDIFQAFPGMPGLFVASLFSASLSSLSSSLSSLSALLWTDFVQPVVGDIADWKATLIAKISVVVCGIVACGLAGLISMMGGTLPQIGGIVIAAVTGPLTGLFFLGCLCPRATAKGAIIGGMVGFGFTCWISSGMSFTRGLKTNPYLPPASTAKCYLGDTAFNETSNWLTNGNMTWTETANQTTDSFYANTDTTLAPTISTEEYSPQGVENLYTISYTFIGAIGMFSTIIFGYIFSIITGANNPEDVDPRYLVQVSQCPGFIKCFFGSSDKQGQASPVISPEKTLVETELNPLVNVNGSTGEHFCDTQENRDTIDSRIPSTALEDNHMRGNGASNSTSHTSII